jgi:hypothetical protein
MKNIKYQKTQLQKWENSIHLFLLLRDKKAQESVKESQEARFLVLEQATRISPWITKRAVLSIKFSQGNQNTLIMKIGQWLEEIKVMPVEQQEVVQEGEGDSGYKQRTQVVYWKHWLFREKIV